MGKYLIAVVIVLGVLVMGFALVGVTIHWTEQTPEEIIKEVNASGSMADRQADILSNEKTSPEYRGDTSFRLRLTSITDAQAESLIRVRGLCLDGLTSISDDQAKILGNVAPHGNRGRSLSLNGLSSITDKQAESLSKLKDLSLEGLFSITDAQAKSLAKIELVSNPSNNYDLIQG